MKKIIKKVLVASLMMLAPLLLWSENSVTYTALYDANKLSLGLDTLGGIIYTAVSYEGLCNNGEVGAPSLPIDYIRFSVPYNATNFRASTRISSSSTTKLNYMVSPCQPPISMNDTTPVVITPPDSNAYVSVSDPLHPSPRAWVVDDGFLYGENHIVTVAVQPIAYYYSPRALIKNAVKQARSVQITLSYDIADSPETHPIVSIHSSLRTEGHELTRSIVVNSNDVEANAPSNTREVVPTHLIEDSIFNNLDPTIYDFPYLIITTEDLKSSVRRIAAIKKQKGYRVAVVTVESLMHNPMFNHGDIAIRGDSTFIAFSDSAGVIRQYLKSAYKYLGTRYVLFAGTTVPYRIIHDESYDTDIPTDFYYCDLNKDWLSGIDKDPELYVGRILAKTGSQINNYTDKLFRYELNPGKGNYSYLNKLFYSEAIDFELLEEWKYIHDSYSKVFPNYTLFREVINGKFPSGTDVVNELNSTHYGFVSLLCHGSPSGFITYGRRTYYEHDTDRTVPYYYLWSLDSVHVVYNNRIDTLDTHTGNGINNMTNKYYPSICYSSGCTSTPYDVIYGYNVETNFGESFTTGKDYGGPAFLGNTREGSFSKTSTGVEKLFVEQLLGGKYKIGVAEAFSRMFNPNSIYYSLVHNLIGEPEFDIWTDSPQVISNITVNRTDNSIFISGFDADSTIVSFSANDGSIGKDIVSTGSIMLNNISPNSTIMLYKHNYIPYIVPMSLQNIILSKPQYVIASDFRAGNTIDSNRTNGDVVVATGAQYEIEASGNVALEGGFKVEKGAVFAVYPASF